MSQNPISKTLQPKSFLKFKKKKGSMRNYNDKIKRYFPFSASELKSIIISIIILILIVGFNDGSKEFNTTNWIINFFTWGIIVTISFLVKQTGHRLLGLFYGFRVEYKLWWYGILISLALTIVTRGKLWVLLTGGIMIHHMKVHRLGWFRYGTNMRAFSMIALAGPVANILFATLIKTFQIWFHLFPADSILVQDIYLFNLALAAFSLLPFPPLDGSRIMFDSRLIYVFTFVAFASYAIFAYFKIYSYLLAIIVAIIAWLFYYTKFET